MRNDSKFCPYRCALMNFKIEGCSGCFFWIFRHKLHFQLFELISSISLLWLSVLKWGLWRRVNDLMNEWRNKHVRSNRNKSWLLQLIWVGWMSGWVSVPCTVASSHDCRCIACFVDLPAFSVWEVKQIGQMAFHHSSNYRNQWLTLLWGVNTLCPHAGATLLNFIHNLFNSD